MGGDLKIEKNSYPSEEFNLAGRVAKSFYDRIIDIKRKS